MSSLSFKSCPSLTLGVEMELQILDARSLDLTDAASRIFRALGGEQPRIKPEIFRSMLEINTPVCETVRQVREELRSAIDEVRAAAPPSLRFAGAGSHPFARYSQRTLSPSRRYRMLVERNQWVARRIMIFGLHIHAGMRDGEHAIAMINGLLPYLPYFLALSASSPFWQAQDTGLASSRITVFEALPTMGHAPTFRSWNEFRLLYDGLVAARSIASIKDLWWDIRPHPEYGTVELRICDGLPTLSEAVAVVALFQALVHRLDAEIKGGRIPEPPPDWLIRENKWRASRHGLDAEIIVDGEGRTVRLRREMKALLESLRESAAALGSEACFEVLARMMKTGCSYERQRRVDLKNRSARAVAEALAEEFRTDLPFFAGRPGR